MCHECTRYNTCVIYNMYARVFVFLCFGLVLPHLKKYQSIRRSNNESNPEVRSLSAASCLGRDLGHAHRLRTGGPAPFVTYPGDVKQRSGLK